MTIDTAGLTIAQRQRLKNELQPGERLLYAGRPSRLAALAGQIPILGFALFWCGITLPIALATWAHLLGFSLPIKGKPPTGSMLWFVSIFLIPFVVVGIGLLASVPLALRRAGRAVHAVTDRRILNLDAGDGAVESFGGHRTKRGQLQISAISLICRCICQIGNCPHSPRGAGKVGNQLTVRQGLSTGIRPEGSDTATTSDFRFLISDF